MNEHFAAKSDILDGDALVRRLAQVGDLGTDEITLLRRAQQSRVELQTGRDLVRVGQQLLHTYVVLSGWLMLHRELQDGRRQVLFLALPGDIVGEFAAYRPKAAYNVTALTDSTVATIQPRTFLGLTRESAALAQAIGSSTARDIAILGDHVVRLGRLSAFQRHCHLMLELWHRCGEIGEIDDGWMPWPLKQADLADILGLSLVHVNRTMMQLKRDGLILVERRRLKLCDPQGMAEVSGFDASSVTTRAA